VAFFVLHHTANSDQAITAGYDQGYETTANPCNMRRDMISFIPQATF
jgi:hypothetical protein